MAVELERLVAVIEARDAQFHKAMQRIEKSTSGTTKRVTGQFITMRSQVELVTKSIARSATSMFTGVLGRVGGGLLVGLGVNELIGAAQAAAAELAKIADVADRVGVATEALQQLRFVVEQNGGAAESADEALKRFALGVADAAGKTGELYKVFQANNIAFQDARGNLLPVMTLLSRYADLVANARTPQEALEFAVRAFGRSAGPDLVASLSQGSSGLRQFMQQATDAGAVLDDSIIRKAAEIDDKFAAISRTVGTQLKGAIIEVVGMIARFVELLNSINLARLRGIEAPAGGATTVKHPAAIAERIAAGHDAFSTKGDRLPVVAKPAGSVPKPPAAPSILPGARSGVSEVQKLKKAYDELNQSAKDRIADLRTELAVLPMTTAQATAYRAEQDMLNEAARENIKLTPEMRAQIAEYSRQMGELAGQLEHAQDQQKAMNALQQEFASLATSALQGLITQGRTLSDVLDDLLRRLADMAIEAAVLQAFSALTGNTGLLSGNPLSALYGGKRAAGGSVSGKKAYVIGERGPELFVPGQSGVVIPNKAMSKSAGIGVPEVNIYTPPGTRSETRPRAGGGLDVVIRQIEGALAERVSRGHGPLVPAFGNRFGVHASGRGG